MEKVLWKGEFVQTLFFNHQSLDLTLSDLSKSEPTVSPDKPMGQLWAASSSVFEAQSLTNSEKSSGIVWKICPREVPWVIRLSLGAAPLRKVWFSQVLLGACFSRQPLRTFLCLSQIALQCNTAPLIGRVRILTGKGAKKGKGVNRWRGKRDKRIHGIIRFKV